jgi:hypothetical protein
MTPLRRIDGRVADLRDQAERRESSTDRQESDAPPAARAGEAVVVVAEGEPKVRN